jgi:hypothetical protein
VKLGSMVEREAFGYAILESRVRAYLSGRISKEDLRFAHERAIAWIKSDAPTDIFPCTSVQEAMARSRESIERYETWATEENPFGIDWMAHAEYERQNLEWLSKMATA